MPSPDAPNDHAYPIDELLWSLSTKHGARALVPVYRPKSILEAFRNHSLAVLLTLAMAASLKLIVGGLWALMTVIIRNTTGVVELAWIPGFMLTVALVGAATIWLIFKATRMPQAIIKPTQKYPQVFGPGPHDSTLDAIFQCLVAVRPLVPAKTQVRIKHIQSTHDALLALISLNNGAKLTLKVESGVEERRVLARWRHDGQEEEMTIKLMRGTQGAAWSTLDNEAVMDSAAYMAQRLRPFFQQTLSPRALNKDALRVVQTPYPVDGQSTQARFKVRLQRPKTTLPTIKAPGQESLNISRMGFWMARIWEVIILGLLLMLLWDTTTKVPFNNSALYNTLIMAWAPLVWLISMSFITIITRPRPKTKRLRYPRTFTPHQPQTHQTLSLNDGVLKLGGEAINLRQRFALNIYRPPDQTRSHQAIVEVAQERARVRFGVLTDGQGGFKVLDQLSVNAGTIPSQAFLMDVWPALVGFASEQGRAPRWNFRWVKAPQAKAQAQTSISVESKVHA